MFTNFRRRDLVWMDGAGGLIVGAVVLPASPLLSAWHHLPVSTLQLIGIANLLYGTYSLSLASRKVRPLSLIQFLIGANLFWSGVCVGIVMSHRQSITLLGTTHLILEAVYVGGLGLLEWRWRDQLR